MTTTYSTRSNAARAAKRANGGTLDGLVLTGATGAWSYAKAASKRTGNAAVPISDVRLHEERIDLYVRGPDGKHWTYEDCTRSYGTLQEARAHFSRLWKRQVQARWSERGELDEQAAAANTVGTRRACAAGSRRIREAQRLMRAAINDRHMLPKDKATAISDTRNLVQYMEAHATTKELPLLVVAGDNAVVTGDADAHGMLPIMWVEGYRAGRTGVHRPIQSRVLDTPAVAAASVAQLPTGAQVRAAYPARVQPVQARQRQPRMHADFAVQSNRPVNHGITRMSQGSIGDQLWVIYDRLLAAARKTDKAAGAHTVTLMQARAAAEGKFNRTTIALAFYQWRRFHGVRGRGRKQKVDA